jgi:hypothetical protein
MAERMFTFAILADRSEIFVHADVAAIRSLVKRLEMMAARAEAEGEAHLHLFSDDWMGDGDLTKNLPVAVPDSAAADHVKIVCWSKPQQS